MKPHVKNYLLHYGYGYQDVIICESCKKERAVDIHHILFRSRGGTDEVSNLIACCRSCHEMAHKSKEFNRILKERKQLEFNK